MRNVIISLAGLLVAIANAQTVNPCFNSNGRSIVLPSSSNPKSINSGDFNNDGKLDLALISLNKVNVLLSKGGGYFDTAKVYSVGSFPKSLLVKDFNSDGKLDIAVVNAQSNNVSILKGIGNGNFNVAINYSVGTFPSDICSGDFNSDNRLDIGISYGGNVNYLTILYGNASGGYTATNINNVDSFPTKINSGDFNGDGKLDLAYIKSSNLNDSVSISLGNGLGTFTKAGKFGALSEVRSFMTDDMNNDGKSDLTFCTYAYGITDDSVKIFTSFNNGMFQNKTAYYIGRENFLVNLRSADFNNDGKADILLSNIFGNNLMILLGQMNNAFSSPKSYILDAMPSSTYIADFNNDGILDVSATTSESGTGNSNWTSNFHFVSFLFGLGNGEFAGGRSYYSGNTSSRFHLSDFDNDGKFDLAVSNFNSPYAIKILKGQGNGEFLNMSTYLVNQRPLYIKSADFNKDGIMDMAFNYFQNNVISIMFGLGNGNFGAANNHSSGSYTSDVEKFDVVDINNDSNLDLIIAKPSLSNVTVSLGTSSGTFSPPVTYSVGNYPTDICVGDFNNDNQLDIAALNYGSNSLSVLNGTGNGTFMSAVNYPLGNHPIMMTKGDFNADGKLDIVIAHSSLSTPSSSIYNNKIAILINSNSGFLPPSYFITGQDPADVVAADFNVDGLLDIATSNFKSCNTSVLLGNGGGGFFSKNDYVTGPMSSQNEAADLNSDGRPDIVVTNGNFSSYITVLLSASPINVNVISSDSSICIGESVTLNANGAQTYLWNNGIQTSGFNAFPTTTATYTVVGTSINGCINTVSKTIIVNPLLNTLVTQNADTLRSQAIGATYQWINCANNTIIPNAINQTYVPITNGSYAVIVNDSACSDTSACINFTLTGIESLVHGQFKLYPNPNNGDFLIESLKPTEIKISNVLGEVVFIKTLVTGKNDLSLKSQPNGIYFINGEGINWKMLKQ